LGASLAVVRALLVGPDGFLKHDVRKRLRRDKADAQGGVAGFPGLNEETSQGDALAATEDDVLTGTDAVDQSDLKRVSEVRQTLSSGLAVAPSVSDACESLNMQNVLGRYYEEYWSYKDQASRRPWGWVIPTLRRYD
jgi:hypothetical protein